MLTLSRKVDYALVAMAHLLENPTQVVSAREVASAHDLPRALLMNILKRLHQAGLVSSTRGVRGGYRISVNLDDVSLAEVIEVVENIEHRDVPVARRMSLQAPVRALQYKLLSFLQDVKLSDLLKPGRRIDVPLENLRIAARASV
jgi:Rrf2 family protein